MTTIKINYKKEKPLNIDYLANAFPVTNVIYTGNNSNNNLNNNQNNNPNNNENNQTITYNPFHIRDIQNYNPIYSRFFELTETNYNKVTLNQKYGIVGSHIIERETEQVAKQVVEKAIFFKFAPLLDPVRYMIGKYDLNDPSIKTLPSITNIESCFHKIADPNNVAYIDAFFSYLGSQLLHTHNVFHSADFYGSYVGIQELFKTNVTDEMEYLQSSDFFSKHLNKEFYLENQAFHEYMNYGSRNNRQRIQISNNSCVSRISLGVEELDFQELDQSNEVKETTEEVVYEKDNTPHNQTCSTMDSISSSQNSGDMNYSSDEDNDDNNDDDVSDDAQNSDSDENSDSEHSSSETQEEEVYAFIKNFPMQMICLEKCDGTLDELFMSDELDISHTASCFFQIIMTLIIYQKAFAFTHNDLHTNNIMYTKTDIEYLYYCYQSKYYRVPTYGRIFKIIDFGRSIYKFQGKTFCSDSFAVCGDAYSQYNCEPYINKNKPRIDPNFSFDLCRLGCSIYDFIMDENDTIDNDFKATIARWCTDDNGKNMLYKRNGEERYPGFKLYKMIARNVHKHTPQEQLTYPFFNQFKMSMKQMNKYNIETIRKHGINIDEIPSYAT